MYRRLFILTALTVLACTQDINPIGTTDNVLNVVRQGTTAPPLRVARDSFWAKAGQAKEFRMFYQGAAPGDTGPEFLLFEVPGDGLLRRPNGLIFRTGDSILITVQVEDVTRFRYDITPAGLLFNAANPARMRLRYSRGNQDFDNDGDQDGADAGIEQDLDIWYRASTSTLWFRQFAVKFEQQDEISVNVEATAHYALGW
jgi:hypothetical protein